MHTCIIINASYKGSVLSLKENQQHNIGFPTFKLSASTEIHL